MNVERMLYLAEQLENPTDPKLSNVDFDMNFFFGSVYDPEENKVCGTVACIGGHACILFGDGVSTVAAQQLLDLDRYQMVKLFYNKGHYVSHKNSLSNITRAEAVEAILRMVNAQIDSDWAKAEEAEKAELVEA